MELTDADLQHFEENGVVFECDTATGEPPLSEREAQEYKEDSETIVNELGSFLRVGMALKRINEKRLYREKYKTFELCVRDLFELGRRRAYQLMDAAGVVEQIEEDLQNVSNLGQNENVKHCYTKKMPENEKQALALLQVPKEERHTVWLKTLERTEGKITARKITETIRETGAAELKKKSENSPTGKEKRSSNQAVCESFDTAYKVFVKEVADAYLSGWKEISKKEVIKHLQTIIDYIEIH